MTDDGVKVQRAVRLMSMQIDRDGGNRGVRQPERNERIRPPMQIEKPGKDHPLALPT
jgi:hypothetical protein